MNQFWFWLTRVYERPQNVTRTLILLSALRFIPSISPCICRNLLKRTCALGPKQAHAPFPSQSKHANKQANTSSFYQVTILILIYTKRLASGNKATSRKEHVSLEEHCKHSQCPAEPWQTLRWRGIQSWCLSSTETVTQECQTSFFEGLGSKSHRFPLQSCTALKIQ